MARRGRSQFQFTIVELAVLGVSFAVTSCLVFLLGFYVGRQVASRHGPPQESVARIPEDDGGVLRAPGGERRRAGRDNPPRDGARPAGERAPGAATEVGGGAETGGEVEGAAPGQGLDAAGPRAYTVQVLATRNRKEAESLSESLEGRGLAAFIAPVEDASGKWYRVRIGRYQDPASAREMAERCRREIGLPQAYVSPY
ncbi:MAG: SPOR domain-containing protein [Candidatus Binatia bacterium]